MQKETIKKYEEANNIDDLGSWLYTKYITEQKSYREIMTLLNTKNNRIIKSMLEYFNIPIRYGSDAIKTQYVGEKGKKRKEVSVNVANTYLQTDESRNKLKACMQTEEYKEKISKANSGKNNGMWGICGEQNILWNPNISDEERVKQRKTVYYSRWRKAVLKRDNKT